MDGRCDLKWAILAAGTDMRIQRLTLQSFRGFEDAALDLDRPLTVLFGENGSGKSSVLAAAAMALSEVVDGDATPDGDAWSHAPFDSDIRTGADQCSVHGLFTNGGRTQKVEILHRRGARPSNSRSAETLALVGAAPVLMAFYDASRSVAPAEDAFDALKAARESKQAWWLYPMYDALAPGHLGFKSLFQWFKVREDIENELKVSRQDLSLEDPQLGAIRRAVAGMLPGFSGLRIQRDPLHMVIRKGDEVLALDQLSDGEKLLLAVTADLARRLAITYANSADPLQGEGVVLIDEIELHLHPAWQRRVLGALRRTFPNCQFIATTHSPQILSEVPNDAVVFVDDFKLLRPGAPTAGRDSNAILTEAMDTPERPIAQVRAIRAISALLDENKYDEAREKLDALARDVSEKDREVVNLRTMLHFLEGGDEAHSQGG